MVNLVNMVLITKKREGANALKIHHGLGHHHCHHFQAWERKLVCFRRELGGLLLLFCGLCESGEIDVFVIVFTIPILIFVIIFAIPIPILMLFCGLCEPG